MKILVIGSGGREHAIIKKIKQNKNVSEIYAISGNGGIERDAICIDIKATDINAIKDFAKKNNIDYAIVTPDDPLVAGLVDALEEIKIPCFGPNKNAAIIEGSKVFAKNLMKKYEIPTAEYETFESYDKAIEYLKTAPMPTVIKADGLALGKGVIIAETKEKAFDTVKNIMKDKAFGKSGDRIVIVEFENKSAACIIMASEGYPLEYKKGFAINIPKDIIERVYFAGVKKENEKLLTNGGRVLGITNIADTLDKAIKLSYEDAKQISFEGAYYRKDIGEKALLKKGNN